LVEEVLVGCLKFLLDSVDSLIEVVHEVLLVLIGVIVGTEASRIILLTLLEVDYFLFKLFNLVLVLFNDLLTEMRSLRQFLLHLLMVC
jgi:hypothetical protein